jgi:hypothetical protein
MGKGWWRWARAIAGAIILVVLVRNFLHDWKDTQTHQVAWHFRWEFIIASLLVTWVMYAVLIWGWRLVLHGWGQWIRAIDAARIWSISSLGKYIPGKVWAIAGMAVMAEKEGVSGAAATGSAIIMQLLSLATGTVLAIALLGTTMLAQFPGGSLGAIALAIFALLGAISLASPSVTRRIGFVVGRPDAVQPVDPNSLAGSIFANLIAWSGYGLAFQLLAAGTVPSANISWATATGAFAASYIGGYLMLFAPAGVGIREGLLIFMLKDTIGLGPATALAAASRITLTINELGIAVPFLLRWVGKPRDA